VLVLAGAVPELELPSEAALPWVACWCLLVLPGTPTVSARYPVVACPVPPCVPRDPLSCPVPPCPHARYLLVLARDCPCRYLLVLARYPVVLRYLLVPCPGLLSLPVPPGPYPGPCPLPGPPFPCPVPPHSLALLGLLLLWSASWACAQDCCWGCKLKHQRRVP
jgi:hypothetical protein